MRIQIIALVGAHTSASGVLAAVASELALHHSVSLNIFGPERSWRRLRFIFSALMTRADVVVLRQSLKALPLLAVVVPFLRGGLGRQVVVHIPTPTSTQYLEMRSATSHSPNAALAVALALDHFVRRSANAVVQNSYDVNDRMSHEVVLANPIIDTVIDMPRPTARRAAARHAVGIASNGFSHGYERAVRGLAHYLASQDTAPGPEIYMTFVGPVAAFSVLNELADRLQLGNFVRFIGPVRHEELDGILADADFGLGVLGNHRVGLSSGSALKHKEFLRQSLPFVTSMHEVGVPRSAPWIHRVPPTDEAIDIGALLEWMDLCDRRLMLQDVQLLAEGPLSPSASVRAVAAILKCDSPIGGIGG